jgi:hypothetical protein
MTTTKTKYTEEELLKKLKSRNPRSRQLAVREARTEKMLLKALDTYDTELLHDILENPHVTETVLLRLVQLVQCEEMMYRDVVFTDVANHPNTTPKVIHALLRAWVKKTEKENDFLHAVGQLFNEDPIMRLQFAALNAQDPVQLDVLH